MVVNEQILLPYLVPVMSLSLNKVTSTLSKQTSRTDFQINVGDIIL